MTDLEKELKDIICRKVFLQNTDMQIDIDEDPQIWMFDFRAILMNGRYANLISEIFYQTFRDMYPFQVGSLETAGIPIATSIVNKCFQKGHEDATAFFVRKSRKKSGLFRVIEGEVEDGKDIILVDDLMNMGDAFWKQVEALEALGHRVNTVWSIVRFRNPEYYQRFHDRGITIRSIFSLDDFTDRFGEQIKDAFAVDGERDKEHTQLFTPKWIFKSENPSYGYVVSKSQPILDERNIYFGADNRTFWAIDQSTGAIVWKYRVGLPTRKKSIFSNPALYRNLVIFGSYDGNVYALERETGKRRWMCIEADFVGSSPAIADDIGLVFIGLEFGLIRKRGGIIALDAKTGKVKWLDRSHPALTHSSPYYIQKHGQVIIGSNDGTVRMYDARNGKKLWSFTTFGGADYDSIVDGGFGNGDIKEGFAYDPKRDLLAFGSIDGHLYILKRKTGDLVHYHTCEFGIWSTPLIYDGKIYFTSVDKRVRCIDLDSFELLFEQNLDNTRIFSSPVVINNRLYVGTNAGRLHELNAGSGEIIGYFQALERITNSVVYNQATDTYFLPTFANEIIQLKRKEAG